MQIIKRTILMAITCILVISGSIITHAQTSKQALQNVQQKLDQQAKEKQSVTNQIDTIKQQMDSLNTYISKNKEAMASTQQKIDETNQLIEKKKEEIVTLEDNILARKGVMKKRLVALQHDDNVSLVIKVILDSKSFDDFLQRASAVTALFDADKSILGQQQNDLQKIEADKKEIDSQGQILADEQENLVQQQGQLSQNLQKRQVTLTTMQEKYNEIDKQMALANNQKAGIVAQIKAEQEMIRKEQEAAKARAAAAAAAAVSAAGNQQAPATAAGNGEEMYVTATAYTPYDSGSITTSGYNIRQNPNMKLIAVDPSVIPLGKRVWVEGYGEAIAGDTGGAIVGHRIDVLLPTKGAAKLWGRRTVRVVVLN